MEHAKVAMAKRKRGATEDLEGPRRRDQDGEARAGGGASSASSGEVQTGEPTLPEARGPEQDAAAAAAGGRDDARREEEAAGQPGQGGSRIGERIATTQRPKGAGAHRAGTTAGLETVAEEDEGVPGGLNPAGAEGAAAADRAAEEE